MGLPDILDYEKMEGQITGENLVTGNGIRNPAVDKSCYLNMEILQHINVPSYVRRNLP